MERLFSFVEVDMDSSIPLGQRSDEQDELKSVHFEIDQQQQYDQELEQTDCLGFIIDPRVQRTYFGKTIYYVLGLFIPICLFIWLELLVFSVQGSEGKCSQDVSNFTCLRWANCWYQVFYNVSMTIPRQVLFSEKSNFYAYGIVQKCFDQIHCAKTLPASLNAHCCESSNALGLLRINCPSQDSFFLPIMGSFCLVFTFLFSVIWSRIYYLTGTCDDDAVPRFHVCQPKRPIGRLME